MSLPKLGILVGPKGRGSNMRALVQACLSGHISADVGIVIASKEDAPALEVAQSLGVRTQVVAIGDDYGLRLLQSLEHCALICLAGYLRLVPNEVLQTFPRRILNVHPALLPKFGGKGMYGHHVHEAVIAAGETESGCTVHYVTSEYDEGEIVLQKSCPILPTDLPEDLATRVLALEHLAYPEAVALALSRL